MSRLSVVGIGPGNPEQMTPEARRVIEEAEVIVGYQLYVDMVRLWFPEKQYYMTGMRGELDRITYAIDCAEEGRKTAVICSGDAEVYGMASLVMEVAEKKGMDLRKIRIVPGITAALSCGAVLGSPLSCDFAVISLSDQLVPWERIEKRLESAARGDLPMVLYNPGSHLRKTHLSRACQIIGAYKKAETVCAVVRNAGREGESYRILTLAELAGERVDMLSTVFIGSEDTRTVNDRMITPRGYSFKYNIEKKTREQEFLCQKTAGIETKIEKPLPEPNGLASAGRRKEILIFGGTTEGRKLAEAAHEAGYRPTLSVASDYGRETAEEKGASYRILSGKMPEEDIRNRLSSGRYRCVIDATHPYAEHISGSIARAAEAVDVRCLRVFRVTEDGSGQGVRMFPDVAAVIRYLNRQEGNIFFATGSNASEEYAKLAGLKNRAYVRILPSEKALAKVRKAGFQSSHILCMQGPFSEEMNTACFRYAEAEWLVTKSSGKEGGYDSKLSAAKKLGMKILVIEAPVYQKHKDTYSFEEILWFIREKRL